ncbi:transposase [Amycolatopsis pretoriensis]|uniref:transposase n=1 Tax=Amycolatopsis pretoriensis TaxID=218821 RepID=UPI000A364B18
MAAPRKYPDELRERATRLAVEARRDPVSAGGAIKWIADQLGVHPEALRTWVKAGRDLRGNTAGHDHNRGGRGSRSWIVRHGEGRVRRLLAGGTRCSAGPGGTRADACRDRAVISRTQ